jgi:hypothetical protein
MSDKAAAKKRHLSESDTSDAAPSPKRSYTNNSEVPPAPISSRKRSYESSDEDSLYRQSKRRHYNSHDEEANVFIPQRPLEAHAEVNEAEDDADNEAEDDADNEAEDESDNTYTDITLLASASAQPAVPAPAQPVFECPVCYTDGSTSGHATPTCGHKICLGCYTNIAVRSPDAPICPCCRKPYMAIAEILEDEPRQNEILYLSQVDALLLSYILGIGPRQSEPEI